MNIGESIGSAFQLLFSITPPEIKQVIFNYPATIVLWEDGSKTVVKTSKDDVFDKEKGVLLAFMKKVYGTGYYREIVRKIEATE